MTEVVLALVAAAALFLVAAKAHGREVRLERVRMGFPFLRVGGGNAPEVEALWSLDRRSYWAAAGVAAVFGLLSFLVPGEGLFGLSTPWDPVLEGATRVVLLPMVLAFAASGGASVVRKRRKGPLPASSRNGSLFWWALVIVLFASFLLVHVLS